MTFDFARFDPKTGAHFSDCSAGLVAQFDPKTGAHFSDCAFELTQYLQK